MAGTDRFPHLLDARHRDRVIEEIERTRFDLAIVGGGINGAGVAHDAALRGLKVVLLEQRDLGFGTSSRSSKLIHGGLRYLEHRHFRLVFEGTNERAVLRRMAPHLVRPLLFTLPVYEGARHPLWMMDVGLWMYDGLSLFKTEQRHITLRSPKRMLEREPLLNPEGLAGGIIYYDCITDDARLVLENTIAAARSGALVLTRAQVTGLSELHGTGPARLTVLDKLSGREIQVRATGVINTTGVWTDEVRRMAELEGTVLTPTKGVHIVVPAERLAVKNAVAMLAVQDGRVMFAIPWNGRTVLGTTDTFEERFDPSELAVDAGDVKYLLEAANHAFPSARLTEHDVIASWVGLRPLIKADEDAKASDVPREHKIFRDGKLVTVAGGKLTTYRRMAAEIVDAAVEVIKIRTHDSGTAKIQLPGAIGLMRDLDAYAAQLEKQSGLPRDVVQRLANVYGSRAPEVLAYAKDDPHLAERVTADRDVIYAEVAHAVERELAVSVDDVLIRRTSIGLTATDQGISAMERVADLIGARLGWDARRRKAALDEYAHTIALSRKFRSGGGAKKIAGVVQSA